MNKNIKKIQSMLQGHYGKPQVGYIGKTVEQRKEGEQWTDANNLEWIKENGKRKQITNVPGRGFDNCKDCNKLILKQRDEDTYNRMGRCYYCQINFEVDLKAEGKWTEWVFEQENMRWEAVEKEVATVLKEMKENASKAFDKSIANTLANENVTSTMRKNRG
jgi:lipopolysaccharide biosynthesis glycosyltransferase